ncbi:MAG: hypothetical protein KIH10_02395, partial [Candidatus Freyarchaeota archaeon]|nr:hypothetical protein [Candidatus Jordarchaeia archaeon]
PPVCGEETSAIMYSILNEPPPPIGGIPRELEGLIFRALSKRKEERFNSVDVMLDKLERLVF